MKLLQMEKFLWGINFISDLWLIKGNSISLLKYQLRLNYQLIKETIPRLINIFAF